MNSIRDEFVQEIRELEAKQASALAESFRSHFSNLDQTFETDFERYQPELRFLDFLRKQKRQEFQQAIGQAFNKYLNDQIAAWSLTAERQQEQAFSQLANRAANYAVSYTRATDKITEAVTNQIPTTIDQSTTNDQSPVWLKWLAGGTSLLTGDIVGAGMAAPGAFNWKNILVNVGTVFATNVILYATAHVLLTPVGGALVALATGGYQFHVLPWHENPLGIQRTVSYLPGASLLRYMRSSDPTAKGALVVGDPYKTLMPDNRSNLPVPGSPIPGTRITASLVASIYGTQPFVGTHATKDIVRDEISKDPRIIHFATHGYFVSNQPLASGIALADGTALSADEVMGLKIKADVVVLGACQTGLGELQGSELVGLARSLLYAGARAVIVTLWNANDLATALLMQSLHRRLGAGISTSIALQQAVDELRHITVQQTLDFCTVALADFPRQSKEEQAAYATLLCSKGDVLATGDDFKQAVATYCQAVTVFQAIGYNDEINKLEKIIASYTRRAKRTTQLQFERHVFDHPTYWAAFEVIGDWR